MRQHHIDQQKLIDEKRKFEIGSYKFAGVLKLLEECSELSVVLAKLVTVDGGEYWEGRDLESEIIEELGDVLAAAKYFMSQSTPVISAKILKRRDEKVDLFIQWHNEEREKLKQ